MRALDQRACCQANLFINSTLFAYISGCLVASLLLVCVSGCNEPGDSAKQNTSTPADSASVKDTVPLKDDGKPKQASTKPQTEPVVIEISDELAEKIAAAKQSAKELGIAMKEDSDGHVISLDTAANRSWVDDYQMQQILVFPYLQSLVLEGPSISDQLAPQIAGLTELTSLTLKNTLIGDTGLAELPKLKKLKIIDLRLSPLVTDASMKSLAQMPQLRAVRVSGCNISDAGLKMILQLPHLSELDIRNCRKLTRAGIEMVAGKSGLKNLKIGGGLIDDSIIPLVAKMKTLQGLSLDNCNLSDAGLRPLENLSLVDLTLYQTPRITDAGLQFLKKFDRLKKLTLRDIAATGDSLRLLPNPNLLVSLNLAQSGITDREIPSLASFNHLSVLILNETKITDTAIETLEKMKSLKKVEMTQTGVTQSGADRLKKSLPDCDIRIN